MTASATTDAVRKCRLVTMGCKVNQYETQLVKEALEQSGYREAAPQEPADLCVVNTCTVTGEPALYACAASATTSRPLGPMTALFQSILANRFASRQGPVEPDPSRRALPPVRWHSGLPAVQESR